MSTMKPKKRLLPLLTPDVNEPKGPRKNPREKPAKAQAPKVVGKLRIVRGWIA